MTNSPVAVVTGASSGIGAATARKLANAGYSVVIGARRADRLAEIADEIGGTALPLDVTSDESVAEFARKLDRVDVLVNNAGGALGTDTIAQAKLDEWQAMYATNVLGTLRMTKSLLPKLIGSGAGTIVLVTSTAGLGVYEGGGGYTAAKHGEHAMAGTLRLELCGEPVRVIEINPGMVKTEEFSLNRFHGDQARADKVYAGVEKPLTADDVADAIAWCITRPQHVNIDAMTIRPIAQAANYKVHRT